MEVAAIGLEDEVVVRPEEVDLDAAVGDLDGCVEERRREVAPGDQRQHLCLQRAFELAARLQEQCRSAPFVDQVLKHLHPSASGIDGALDRRDVEHGSSSCRRPLDGAAQRPFADYTREVHQRPRRARAGDAVERPGLLTSRRPHKMQVDAVDLSAARGRSDDIDHDGSFVDEPQQGCGAAMGNHSSLAAGENGGHEAAALAAGLMSNRIDTAENQMQPADLSGTGDRRVAHP